MKKGYNVLAAVLLVLFVFTGTAVANDGTYFSIGGKLLLPGDLDAQAGGDELTFDTDKSFGFTGAVGKRFANGFRGEAEVGYRQLEGNASVPYGREDMNVDIKAKVDITTVMANFFYDWNNNTRFTPYVGGGLGVGFFQPHVTVAGYGDSMTFNDLDTTSAVYQLMAGVNVAVVKNVELYGGWNYFNAVTDPYAFGGQYEVGHHSAELGARFFFGN